MNPRSSQATSKFVCSARAVAKEKTSTRAWGSVNP